MRAAFVVTVWFFAPGAVTNPWSSLAQETTPSPQPTPIVQPIDLPTPSPTPPGSIAIEPPPAPSVNAEESIPVVVTYGEGQETRASITQGLMEPVGVPRAQSVTVTLLLPSTYAGQPVALGLYDGGQVGAVTLPGQDMITFTDPGVPLPMVAADGKVQFNFKAGATLGLYRLQVTVGPGQYLLQFYAVRPRSSDPLPVPTPNPPPIS